MQKQYKRNDNRGEQVTPLDCNTRRSNLAKYKKYLRDKGYLTWDGKVTDFTKWYFKRDFAPSRKKYMYMIEENLMAYYKALDVFPCNDSHRMNVGDGRINFSKYVEDTFGNGRSFRELKELFI